VVVVVVVVVKEGGGGEISSFQVIHEALSKLYPMIYQTDVLADPWRKKSPVAEIVGETGNIVQERGEEEQNSLVQSSPQAILPKVVLVFHACARSV